MRRRFPKRVWLVNNKGQTGGSVEVIRSPETAASYRSDEMKRWGWEVVEYVRAMPCTSGEQENK